MLPRMAFTSSLAFVAVLLLCFSFSVNPQPPIYLIASAPASWTNSPSLPHTSTFQGGENVRSILLRLNTTGGMSFATGFYCFPPCKSFFLSIYIVYAYNDFYGYAYYIPPQVVWSANRARPVSENATLQLTSKDGLTLRDSDGSIVWTTSGMNQSVTGINITTAGNLVLFDINNSTIWQSFDHPTDCLVLGQTLEGGMRIIANSSSTDLAESQFYLTLLADGLYGFVNSNPPLAYYYVDTMLFSISSGTVDNSTFIKFMNGNLSMFSTLPITDNRIIFEFKPTKFMQYIRLESDGHLRLYNFDDFQWKIVGDLFSTGSDYPTFDNCDYPTVCGHYGICNNGQCTCPAGTSGNYFKLIDNRRAELGCYAVTNITCQDANNHLLLDLNNVSYFSNIADNVAFDTTSEESCKKACLIDCNCKAALFQSSNENFSYGKCLTLSEVFSLKNYQPDAGKFTSSVFIKVQASSSKVGLGAILGSIFGALLFMVTLIIIYIVCLRRREEEQDEDIIEQLPGIPTRFTFEDLRVATESFVKILGKGAFGTVFEGRWGDKRIAVKRLDNVGHGKKDFLAEVETIGSIHHMNLVRLIGFCADKLNRLLVYEYMCNGSLDQWIYCRYGRVPLDWPIRFKIITDIAKGLCYLHEECNQKIVHFDIKPENILLDENFQAKVADFGLSKLIDRDISRVMTKMRGTPGYLAPEWLTAMVTEKVDVYSFGVVVMEILCGRRNIDDSLTEENRHLIKLLEEKSKTSGLSDLIDNNLGDVQLYRKEIMNVMELAMWCLQWDSTRRPSMLIVVKVLEGAMEVETSLDYNFVSSISMIANIPDIVDQSASLQTSVLSGPR